MSELDIQPGDRVRVVLEGRVASVHTAGFGLGGNFIVPGADHVVSVERLKPPVVTFKPGDFVRHLSGSLYLVADKGRVVSLQNGRTIDDPTWYKKYLNSEWYTKVELHEAPL